MKARCVVWAASAAMIVTGNPARGQAVTSPQPSADQNKDGGALALTEIVVTATKRSERLQDVPIAVSVVGDAMLQNRNSSSLADLNAVVPTLQVTENLTGQQINIRGIGSGTSNPAFEQSVATFVDGIYLGRGVLAKSLFLDVGRVEVVRGPQPLFAGQNAIGGAINIVTHDPGDSLNGFVHGAYGSDHEGSIEAAIGFPVTDNLSVRAAGRYYDLGRNYPEVVTGAPQGTTRDIAARLIADWHPTEALRARIKYEHQDDRGHGIPEETVGCERRVQFSSAGPFAPLVAPCTLQLLAGLGSFTRDGRTETGGALDYVALVGQLNAQFLGQPGFPLSSGPILPGLNGVAEFNTNTRKLVSNVVGGTIDLDLDSARLTSTTGYISYRSDFWGDPDGTSIAFFASDQPERFKQFSQELRLVSPTNRRFSWMLGGYYQNSDLYSSFDVFFPTGVAPGATLDERARWLSAFFSAAYRLTGEITLSGGARYTDIRKTANLFDTIAVLPSGGHAFGPRVPGDANVPLRFRDAGLNPETEIQWKKGRIMLYGRYAEAFKGGGFVLGPPLGAFPPTRTRFNSEHARTFEVGAKTSLFDRRMTANVALFTTGYRDLQVSVFDPNSLSFVTENAAAARSKGVEVDGRLLVARGFLVNFGASLLDTRYKSYPGAACYAVQAKQFALASGQPSALCTQDLSGKQLPFAAHWSFTISPDIKIPVSEKLKANWFTTLFVSDGYNVSPSLDPAFANGTYARIDTRVALGPPSDLWSIAAYVNNITDKRILTITSSSLFNRSSDPNAADGIPSDQNRGRSYGLQLQYKF